MLCQNQNWLVEFYSQQLVGGSNDKWPLPRGFGWKFKRRGSARTSSLAAAPGARPGPEGQGGAGGGGGCGRGSGGGTLKRGASAAESGYHSPGSTTPGQATDHYNVVAHHSHNGPVESHPRTQFVALHSHSHGHTGAGCSTATATSSGLILRVSTRTAVVCDHGDIIVDDDVDDDDDEREHNDNDDNEDDYGDAEQSVHLAGYTSDDGESSSLIDYYNNQQRERHYQQRRQSQRQAAEVYTATSAAASSAAHADKSKRCSGQNGEIWSTYSPTTMHMRHIHSIQIKGWRKLLTVHMHLMCNAQRSSHTNHTLYKT